MYSTELGVDGVSTQGRLRRWLPLVAVCAGTFMLLVDVTIVIVALPDMAQSLDASLADLQWVMSGYALVLAALVLTAGSVADRVGRRRVYLTGLVVFALASLMCGVSGSVGLLIAARGLQGLAAAAMFATTLALLSTAYDGRDRGIAFGVWAAVNGAAAAAGPLLGGVLTASFGWRSIFLVNLPIAIAAVVLTLRVVVESKDPHPRSIDLRGMVAFTLAAGALVYALIRGSWTSGVTLALLALAAGALVVFVVVEHTQDEPMLDLVLVRDRSFATLLVTAALLPAAAWAFLSYQTLWLQSVLGLSAIEAGLVMLPASVTTFSVSIAVGRAMHRVSPRVLVGTGMLVIAAGALAETAITERSGWGVALPGLFLVGLGAGLALGPLSAAAMAAVPPARAGMAGGALNSFRQLGYALGVAVLGAVFSRGLDGSGQSMRQAYAAALDQTYAVAAAFALIAGLAMFAFVRPARSG
jgi:EmrB/QacA subfamily drug resistance transporter